MIELSSTKCSCTRQRAADRAAAAAAFRVIGWTLFTIAVLGFAVWADLTGWALK